MPLEICSLYSYGCCVNFVVPSPEPLFGWVFGGRWQPPRFPPTPWAFLPHAQPANQQSINILLSPHYLCLQTLPGNKHNHGRVLRPLLPDHTLDQAHLSVKGSWSRSGRRWLTAVCIRLFTVKPNCLSFPDGSWPYYGPCTSLCSTNGPLHLVHYVSGQCGTFLHLTSAYMTRTTTNCL